MASRSTTRGSNLNHVLALLDDQFRDPDDLSNLARRMHVSAPHLRALFKEKTGLPFHQYIKEQRLQWAAIRLLTEEISISDVGQDCGFKTLPGFSNAFRTRFDMSPTQWQQSADDIAEKATEAVPQNVSFEVTLTERPSIRIAFMRHFLKDDNDLRGYESAWLKFLTRTAMRLVREKNLCFVQVDYDDTRNLGGHACRFDTGITVGPDYKPSGSVATREIPAGMWASLSVRGTVRDLEQAWNWFVFDWLRNSDYRIARFQAITLARFSPNVLHRMTELLSVALDHLDGELRIPVQPVRS